MKISRLSLYALVGCCVAAAACTQTTELSRFPYAPPVDSLRDGVAGAPSYHILHRFGADRDGVDPTGLIGVGDTFYGTTSGGGFRNGGTAFSITAGGVEHVLHSFGKGFEGRQPYAGLIAVRGTFYGTASSGGSFGDGTVFSMTPDGSEKVLHNFGNGTDGKYPSASLIALNGTLYGTTNQGGTNSCAPSEGCGTVFSVTIGGREKVIHSFGKGQDGSLPVAPLIDIAGKLYGTTGYGGRHGIGKYGTVFSITSDGKERVLHSFGEGTMAHCRKRA